MNATAPHDPLDDVLRSLDAAPAALTDAQRARADALLDSLVATTPLAPRRRTPARWLVPAAAAAALVVGAIMWPGNPAVTTAYADWTPNPTPVTGPALDALTEACRAQMADAPGATRAPTARTAIAEQRGSHLFAALTSDNGATMECLARADRPGHVLGATGGAPNPGAATPTPLAPTAIEAPGPGLQGGPDGTYAYTQGRVGADVRAVVLHVDGRKVTASVSGDAFAAWWPSATPPNPMAPDREAVTYDVTLADGTVLHDVDTGTPSRALPGPTQVGRIEVGGGIDGGPTVRYVSGLAGTRVAKVTVHIDGTDRVAEVTDGTFRAVWDAPTAGPVEGSLDDLTFTLTLDDGTVLPRVRPVSGVGR